MVEAVIFDMDGVIFDTEKFWKQEFFTASEKYGLNLNEEYRQKNTVGKRDSDIRIAMKKEFPNADIDGFVDYWHSNVKGIFLKNKNLLKSGFKELVSTLKEHGIKIALATSSAMDRCEILFNNCGLKISEIFDFVVTKENVEKGKPNPEVFLKAIKGLNVKNENSIVLEDSLLGIEAAFRADAMPVMVVDLIMPNDNIKKICKNVVYSLKEAKNYILSLI